MIESFSPIAFIIETNRSFRIGAMKMTFYRTALFERKPTWYHIRQTFWFYQGEMGDGLSAYRTQNLHHQYLSIWEVLGWVYDETERPQEVWHIQKVCETFCGRVRWWHCQECRTLSLLIHLKEIPTAAMLWGLLLSIKMMRGETDRGTIYLLSQNQPLLCT